MSNSENVDRGDLDTDVVVIGAGPVGENVAQRVVRGGLSAVIVESRLLGGECSFYACVPSKALLRPGTALEAAQAVDGARQAVRGDVDAAGTLARRTRQTGDWHDDGQVEWLADAGIGLARGHARIAGERTVVVDGSSDGNEAGEGGGSESTGREGVGEGGEVTLTARHAVVVATGTSPLLPPIPGLADAAPWTNREATRAATVPRRLAVIGGGPVACELATAWRSLGSEQVTLLERGDRLLGRVEPFASDAVAAGLDKQGVTVRTGVSAIAVERPEAGGPVRIRLDDGGEIEADELLVATGRVPNTADLGLDTVGLDPGGWLEADDSGLVEGIGGGWLYAAGDVTHQVLLTHVGKYQGRACGDAIAARARGELDGEAAPAPWGPYAATARHRAVPQVVYTRPEVAAVGMTEAEARDAGMDVRVVTRAIDVAGASLHADDYEGTARIVVDDARRVIVGATFVGPEVGELLHAATIAVVGEVPLDRLWHAVPAFPAVSEVWLRLLEDYGL
jgi:pyruvate/2-oxoglutarate dehydrogenase complex dihydrolipoamide dehydrogenase (E3) component